jgi:hypothetical protein
MIKCENCEKEHNGSYGSGRFCSSKCARGFSTKEKRKEINEKVSKTLTGRKTNIDYSTEKWKNIFQKRKKMYDEKLLNANFDELKFESLRKRVILEQGGKCNNCGLEEWLGVIITLELEHKDGNRLNNHRGNLEALCPNCHSLTSTWRGRNKQTRKNKVTDEALLKALIENKFNMRQSLIQVGLVAKGGNYGRCHRLKKEYDELIT